MSPQSDLEVTTGGLAPRFSEWILGQPKRSIGVGLLLVLVGSLGAIQLEYQYGYRSNYYDGNELLAELDAFEERFTGSEALVMAVHSPSGVFTPDSAELLRHLTAELWKLPKIIRVESLTNYPWVRSEADEIRTTPLLDEIPFDEATLAARRKAALAHELLPGYLVSPDGRTALLFAFPETDELGLEGVELVTGARVLVESVAGRGDHEIYLSGDPVINASFQQGTQRDTLIISPLVSGFAVLLLALFFRKLTGVLLPFVVVGATVGATMGLMGWLGIVMTPMTSAIPQVLIAVCFADSIHLLVSFRLARSDGMSSRDATHYSLVKNFVPTILTSVSTAIGFLSFSTSAHKGLGGFGIGAGLGALCAWPMTYLFLGALLPRLTWGGQSPTPTPLVEWLVRAGTNHGRLVRIAALGCAVGLGAVASQVRVDSNIFEYFPDEHPLNVATQFIEREVGAVFAIEMVVDTGKPDGIKDPAVLEKVARLESWLESHEEVTRANSIVNILQSMNRSLHGDAHEAWRIPSTREAVAQQLLLYESGVPETLGVTDRVSFDYSALRSTLLWSVASAKRAKALVEEFRTYAADELGLGPSSGFEVTFTGRYVLFQRQVDLIVESFVVSVVTAFVLISLLLVVYFRSIWLGMLALLPNLIPLMMGGAILVAMGKTLDLGTVLLTSICLGIAVDDTIHIMASFKQQVQSGKDPVEAIRAVLTHTVPALFVTTAVLVGVLGSFVFATLMANVRFGVMSAIILSAALVMDVIFLPALLLSPLGQFALRRLGARERERAERLRVESP